MFDEELAGWLIFAVRLVLVPLSLWALCLNWRALVDLPKGTWALSQVARAQICFFAMASLLSQFFFLIHSYSPALLLALLLMCGGMALAVNVSLRGESKRLRYGLEKMLDRPDLALPLVELDEVAPAHAERLAQEAIAAIALARAGL